MNWDKDIKTSLDAHLSGLHVSERQQAQMFNRIVQGEKPIMKRKISAALVFAIVLVLAMGTVALAAGLGLFGHFSNPEEGNNAPRLEKLESVADTYEMTKTAAMPTPAVPVTGETMYDKLLAEQYSHTFELTLDQAYCDGHKLYYSYTLRRSAPMSQIFGEGEPTGDFDFKRVEEGKKANDVIFFKGEEKAWFENHDVAYEIYNGFGLGDGAETPDGEYLMILDSADEQVDECTKRGFQEVEIPDSVTVGDTFDFMLVVNEYGGIYYQTEKDFKTASVHIPEGRGFIRVPFTVKVDRKAEIRAGSLMTDAYSAQATVFISDVDISGTVYFDNAEFVQDYKEYDQKMMNGEEVQMPRVITGYELVADDQVVEPIDGGWGVDNKTGQYHVELRYDLPESAEFLSLRPIYSDGEAGTEEEEIWLN